MSTYDLLIFPGIGSGEREFGLSPPFYPAKIHPEQQKDDQPFTVTSVHKVPESFSPQPVKKP
jgi:hypothetical protein